MARVTIDDEEQRDPRFRRLGRMLAPTLPALIQSSLGRGVMIDLWSYLTERYRDDDPSYTIDAATLDDLTDVPDLGRILEVTGLAHQVDDGIFRIDGAMGRIEWLDRLRANGKKGGRPPRETPADSGTRRQPTPNQTESKTEPSYSGSGSGSDKEELPVVHQGRDLFGNQDQERPGAHAVTARLVSFLNAATGRTFDGQSKTTRKWVCARLAEGRTEADLAAVTWDRIQRWRLDERMRDYLRPETLWGHPGKFEGYLAAAEVRLSAAALYALRVSAPSTPPTSHPARRSVEDVRREMLEQEALMRRGDA